MSAEVALAKRAFGQVWIGATVCSVAFGATIASSAVSYVSSFPSEASRRQLAATTGHDSGLSVLLGPVSSIGTVGGYTLYKVFVFLTTIGAIWALLATTRLLRGEEDAGRWPLALSGATRPARATAATLIALTTAVGVIFAGAAALTRLAAQKPGVGFGLGETCFFALGIVVPAVVFVGVGALTSQLGRTRRAATGLGLGLVALAFVVRMVADTGPALHWLLWATPFGWTERMRALTRNDGWPLVPALVATLGLVALAVAMSSRRDVGDGVLASPDVARPRAFGLTSTLAMTVRQELPVVTAWCVGAAASGVMLGIIAKVTASASSGSLNDALRKFGVHGTFARQYFGVVFLLVATVVALLPAGQIGAAGEEETSGRLVHVLARATSRTSWFVGRIAFCGAAIVVAGLVAGLGAWLGARTQGVELGFVTMAGAGLNVVPTALVALGAGALACSIAPRAAGPAVYAIVGWSLIVDLAGSLVSNLGWLGHVSLFHYMALAPAQHADVGTIAVTTALAFALCAGATVLFDRRDLGTG